MSTIFPIEIESEILLRLPAKSLQRFKTVCKTWLNLIISDPIFAASYYQRSSQNPKLLLLKHPIHFSIAPQSLIETTTLPLPNSVVSIVEESRNAAAAADDDDEYREVEATRVELINSNSINGVVGIVVYYRDVSCDIYVWNPSTCETVRLPKSEVSGLFDGPPTVKFYAGFGYDNAGLDYKVVRVVYKGSLNATLEVYSITRNCWKELDSSRSRISTNTLWASEMCTYVGGLGYWGVYEKEEKDKFCLLRFNFGKESFGRIGVPEKCVDGRERKYHSLWEYKGVLAMSVLHFGEFESCSTRHYIWLFKRPNKTGDYLTPLWTSLFNIDLECGPRRPVVSLRSGELVLLGEDDGEHVLYDPADGQVSKLGIADVDYLVLYAESLVSPSALLPKETKTDLTC